MKGVLLKNPYHFEITNIEDPEADDQSVVLKVHSVGICGSDLHAYQGHHPRRTPPVILGHELSGEIVSKGRQVKHLSIGEKATIEPQLACQQCLECRRNLSNLCSNKKLLGTRQWPGALAEYIVAPQSLVHRLPEKCSYDAGAFIEPLAVALRAVKQGGVKKGALLLFLAQETLAC